MKHNHRARLSIIVGKKRKTILVSRGVLSAKLKRPLKSVEHARHMNGIRTDNHMKNLQPGCFINNLLDEVDQGHMELTPKSMLLSMNRLLTYRSNELPMITLNSPTVSASVKTTGNRDSSSTTNTVTDLS